MATIQEFSEKVEWEGDLMYVCQNWPDLIPEELKGIAIRAVMGYEALEKQYESLVKKML